MAKKSKNKKATATKKKGKPSNKTLKKKTVVKVKKTKAPAKSLKKAAKKTLEKKSIVPAKKISKGPVAKASKKDIKSAKTTRPVKIEKPLIKELPPKVEKQVSPGRGPGKSTKPPKPPKEKKIIKAPLIIPNQRITEKEIALVSKRVEPKGKYELEFVVRSSPVVLFELLSTPSGLSEWFADDVNIRDDVFTFFWDGAAQSAKVIGLKEPELIRFQWIDKKDGSYFEFRLQIDELTSDVSLMITDFAENESEKLSSRLLWESQVNKLLHVLGSYF